MPTPIDKNVTRRCPEIKDSDGRQLEVTLNEKDGGTIALRFVGIRTPPLEVSLRTLMKSAELAAEGEDLNVQPGWEDTMVTLLADFGKQVQAIIDQVKADAQPIPEPDENFDEEVDEPEDEDLDDL
jgi:hypothetical protein